MGRRVGTWRLACVFACALMLAGCARGPTLTRTIQPPSLLPLRTFPRVWVATSEQADALRLADAVVAELNAGGSVRARRTTLASLEPARASGRIPAGTAVLAFDSAWIRGSPSTPRRCVGRSAAIRRAA
ncbi:MAG: hypothetical protein GXP55_24850 [Deltaproteobacteria bacterium]|nr:hypothetical protein [Deltaproteobacteria bacterium]